MLLYKKEACATRVQQMRDETIRPHHCYDRGGKDRCIPESPRATDTLHHVIQADHMASAIQAQALTVLTANSSPMPWSCKHKGESYTEQERAKEQGNVLLLR
jgi:hypothetical protein